MNAHAPLFDMAEEFFQFGLVEIVVSERNIIDGEVERDRARNVSPSGAIGSNQRAEIQVTLIGISQPPNQRRIAGFIVWLNIANDHASSRSAGKNHRRLGSVRVTREQNRCYRPTQIESAGDLTFEWSFLTAQHCGNQPVLSDTTGHRAFNSPDGEGRIKQGREIITDATLHAAPNI